MTKILRFPCDLARTMRNTLREFLIVIATVAKASCKHGLWLVVRVNYKKFGGLLSARLFYTLSLNLYPIPQIVSINFGSSGFGSIFFRSFRMNAMILLSSKR